MRNTEQALADEKPLCPTSPGGYEIATAQTPEKRRLTDSNEETASPIVTNVVTLEPQNRRCQYLKGSEAEKLQKIP